MVIQKVKDEIEIYFAEIIFISNFLILNSQESAGFAYIIRELAIKNINKIKQI